MLRPFIFIAIIVIIAAGAYVVIRRQGAPPSQPPTNNQAIQNSQTEEPQKSETIPTGPAGVSIDDYPLQVAAGSLISIKWTVTVPAQTTISQTAIYYGAKSRPGTFGLSVTPKIAAYLNLTKEYLSGTFVVPASFTANIPALKTAGTMYFRAHTVSDGKNYWTEEKKITVK